MAKVPLALWSARAPEHLRVLHPTVARALEDAGIDARRIARQLVPRRTGRLRHTIRSYATRKGRAFTVLVTAGSANVGYAGIQERGARIVSRGRLMTVPIGVRQHPFRPRDLPNTFVLPLRGRLFIVQRQPDRSLRFLWTLREEVTVRHPTRRSPAWPGTIGPTVPYALTAVERATKRLTERLDKRLVADRRARGI